MSIYNLVIVGTGLSSAAALAATLDKDINILIVDVNAHHRPNLSELELNDLEKLHNGRKNFYGSDFATRILSEDNVAKGIDKGAYSHGGFSNIWGGSLDNIDPKIFSNLGIDLTDDTKKILNHVFGDFYLESNGANQKNYDVLSKSSSWEVAKSKLAVNRNKCTSCNLCLYGCYESAIFNSYDFIMRIINSKMKKSRIDIMSSIYVDKINEEANQVSLECVEYKSNKKMSIKTERLFVGAGVFPTAKIFLRSFSSLNQIEIRDSSYFALPVFCANSTSHLTSGIALSSISAKYHDNLKYKYALQLYFPSKYTVNEVATRLRRFSVPNMFSSIIAGRVGIIQGYKHSNISNSLILSKSKGVIVSREVLRSGSFFENELTTKIKDLFKHSGVIPIIKLKVNTNVTDGYHFGASFPHLSGAYNECESDRLGRPFGLKKIHIIDSSVLPFIPSGSHSLTMMANSYRIAKETYL